MTDRIPISKMVRWPMIGCISALLTACQPDSLLDGPEERIARADARLSATRIESQKAVARSREKILAKQETTGAAIAAADEAEASLENAKLELQTLQEIFVSYRNSYRTKLREDILETTFPEVTLPNGRRLKKFLIQGIQNGEVSYTSNGATGRLSLSELPKVVSETLRLEEEDEDRTRFPELIVRRDSDINIEAEAALSPEELKKLDKSSEEEARRERMRMAKTKLAAIYETRDSELQKMLDDLDDTRIKLSAKRRRHEDFNRENNTDVRDSSIRSLSRSIRKIDKRSRLIYEKMNVLRGLMQENR